MSIVPPMRRVVELSMCVGLSFALRDNFVTTNGTQYFPGQVGTVDIYESCEEY